MDRDERLATVETNVEWLVKAVSKMEPKIDMIAERQSFQWGKVLGACFVVEVLISAAMEMFRR